MWLCIFRNIIADGSSSTKKKTKESIVPHSDVEKLGKLATEIKLSEGVDSHDSKGLVFKRIQAHKSGPFDFEDIKVKNYDFRKD